MISVAGFREGTKPFTVSLVAEGTSVGTARPRAGGRATQRHRLGPRWRRRALSAVLTSWLGARSDAGATILSVCPGALDELRAVATRAIVDPSRRYHVHDRMVVAAGVASGVEGALELVARTCGVSVAEGTAT